MSSSPQSTIPGQNLPGSDVDPTHFPVVEPQNTYQGIFASLSHHLHNLLHDAIEPQPQSLDFVSESCRWSGDGCEQTPSSPTFPGAYPLELRYPTGTLASEDQGNNEGLPETVTIQPDRLAPSHASHIVASAFQGAHNFTIDGNTQFINVGKMINNNHIGTSDLDALKEFVSFNALYDSSAQDPERRCHHGTRETVLKQICHWIEDPDTENRILWLHGPAGVGKSAIAQTVAQSFGRGTVAATFFFFRSDSSRNDGNRLFPTLAWQFAKSIPGVRDRIAHALNDDVDIPRKTVEVQFEHLIVRPLVRATTDNLSEVRASPPIVIIDGVDECADDKLQSRFLKIIGNATTDNRTPLRFLISSRPEADIQDALVQFQSTTLSIDLANVDDAHRDIEKYLTAEFTPIAKEHRLDPLTWPGESIIQELILKSCGQFVYACTVIRFVGDKYNSAASQLCIILGLKPSKGKSPFAELDALYIEILQRQPDQEFLKEFLTLLVGQSGLEGRDELSQDDSMLLNVDDNELQRKLRGMHSLLKFEPHIRVHHRSFLDFLQQKSRSGPYHVSEHTGRRRYLELITQVVVQYASKIIKHSDYHEAIHFAPAFYDLVSRNLLSIELPLVDWEEILLPLWSVKNELLKMPRCYELCEKCHIFDVIDSMLLHHQFLRGIFQSIPPSLPAQVEATDLTFFLPDGVARTVIAGSTDGWQQQEFTNISNEPQNGGSQTTSEKEVAYFFSSLIRSLPNTELESSTNVMEIERLRACLSLDPVEAALTVRSVSDAQNLIDLLFYIAKNKQLLDCCPSDLARKVIQLAIELGRTTKLLPRSVFLKRTELTPSRSYSHDNMTVQTVGITTDMTRLYEIIYTWAFLSHPGVLPLLGVYRPHGGGSTRASFDYLGAVDRTTLTEWRRGSNPPLTAIQQCMLELAHVIQFIHSFGVSHYLHKDGVFLSSNPIPKIGGSYFHLPRYNRIPGAKQGDVLTFGRVFYEVLYDAEVSLKSRVNRIKLKDPETFKERPLEPNIPDDMWKLIQRCCEDEPGNRPTIDEIVKEMESWK